MHPFLRQTILLLFSMFSCLFIFLTATPFPFYYFFYFFFEIQLDIFTQNKYINRFIGDKSTINTTNCTIFHLRPGYKRIELELAIYSLNTSFLISDIYFDDFQCQFPQTLNSYCEDSSMICIRTFNFSNL